MKKISSLLIFVVTTSLFLTIFSLPIRSVTDYSTAEIEITARKYILKVNGQPIKLDIAPIWDLGTKNLLIPLRTFADLVGYEIMWDPKASIATFRKNDRFFELHILPQGIILKSGTKVPKYQIQLKSSRFMMDSQTIGTLFGFNSSLDKQNFMVTFYTDRSQIHWIAPDFTLKDIPGKRFNLYETLQNKKIKVVILTFYATRCPICAKAYPDIEKLYEDYKDKGVLVVGINTDTKNMEDQRDEVIAKYHLTYPILLDKDASVYTLYSVSGIPNMFVINQNKEIVQHQLGVSDDYFPFLRDFIDKSIQK